MEDPILNRNLEEIKELQARWNQFHDFVNMAAQQGLAKITPQAEMKFLELKSRIAMLHDGFMGGVKNDVKTAQNIIQIVADCIHLKKVSQASDAEKQKFEFDWNECFMLLNETTSSLEEEKKRLAGINERAYKAAKRREVMKAQFHNFLHSPVLKWFCIIFGTIGALIAGQIFYDYRNLSKNPPIGFTRSIYLGIVNPVWRPFIQPDYEYNDMGEVPLNDKPNEAGAERAQNKTTPEQFVNQFLPSIGLASADIPDAKKIVDERTGFDAELLKLTGDNKFFAIMLKSTADAKRLVDLLNQGLAKSSNAQKIKDTTFIYRSANLLVIGNGPHALSSGYIRDKWKAEKANNELK